MALLTEAQISEAERRALTLYKSNGAFAGEQCFADSLNLALALGQPLKPEFAEAKAALDAMFARSRLGSQRTLYRATFEGYLTRHIIGERLVYPPFMSTGTSEEAVQPHYRTPFSTSVAALLVIDCNAGAAALDGEMLRASFGNDLEQEIILPSGAEFEIVNVQHLTDRGQMAERMSAYFADQYPSLKVFALRYGYR